MRIDLHTHSTVSDGTLTHVVDSQAMQVSANVNGTRSVNVMNALATMLTGPVCPTRGP
jgi:predicted metal-dependent phosphoesterase TrpH